MDDWKKEVMDECRLKGYSSKTIDNYIFHISKFLESKKSPREYLLNLIETDKADETVRVSGFAIKFYLSLMKKDDVEIKTILESLPNLKREKKLPVVLSKEEIQRLIFATKNLNHRLIIQIGYSAGLRVSEIINLKWQDVDFDRDVMHIKMAKGKKDRIVMLSQKVKEALYALSQDKSGFIFITNRNGKYTERTIQKIIENACLKSGMKKKITPHSLRHSFATHLLENGTDIRYIKDLLGHADIKTTLIYTKVSDKNLSNIKSPLDS